MIRSGYVTPVYFFTIITMLDDKTTEDSSTEEIDLSQDALDTEDTDDVSEEETEKKEVDKTDDRLDKHPRFQKLIQQKNDLRKVNEELEKKLAEREKLLAEKEDKEEEEEEPDTDKPVLVKLRESIHEDDFLEEIGVTNSYDGKKVIKEIKGVAQSLLKAGKAKNFKDALRKAYLFNNMEEEISDRAAKLRGKDKLEKVVSYSRGGKGSEEETGDGLTKEELRAAKRFGMTPKEYKQFSD